MNQKKIREILRRSIFRLCVYMFVSCATMSAQTSFTVTASTNTSSHGYIEGESINFIFITGPSFPDTYYSSFNSTTNSWVEGDQTPTRLWSAISATNLSGTFTPPTQENASHFSIINHGDTLSLLARNSYANENIGLFTPSSEGINYIYVSLNNVTPFSFSGSYTEPTDYFPSFYDTYNSIGGSIEVKLTNGESFFFTPTSIVISASVPEPSTYGSFISTIMLFIVIGYRRLARPNPVH